jgi:hypothetical protein
VEELGLMRTVFKYTVPVDDFRHDFGIPTKGKIVHVQASAVDKVDFWVELDSKRKTELRTFFVIGTGHPVPHQVDTDMRYVGTTVIGIFVWHLYEAVAI